MHSDPEELDAGAPCWSVNEADKEADGGDGNIAIRGRPTVPAVCHRHVSRGSGDSPPNAQRSVEALLPGKRIGDDRGDCDESRPLNMSSPASPVLGSEANAT